MATNRSIICSIKMLCALAVLGLASAHAADRSQSDQQKERELIQKLQSDAPPAEKAMACKYLSIYGSPDAVPELAKLLGNEHLASWSRIALEAIPGPAADEALRNAIPTLQGKLLVGTLNSIGVRRDVGAVESLTRQLQNQDAEVASAAAVALGQIGNAPATKALRASLAGASPQVRSAIAEGCVLCAERLLAEGDAAEAAKVYDQLCKADLPKQKILEATRGAILARGPGGVTLLVEQLRSPDKIFFELGLGTARELQGPEVANAVLAEIVGATPERAALLLYVLADRRDTSVLPAVIEAASSGHKQVRIAAISILPRLGDDTCVSPLLKIATSDDKELAEAAKAALAGLPGAKVDADVTGRLAGADSASLPVLIELVGLRRVNAKNELLKATDHSQAAVRAAAWLALGATVDLNNLSILTTEVITPKHPDDAKVAQQALRAACVRMPEREACAEQLTTAMTTVPVSTQCMLIEVLGAMGGTKALETLGSAAKGSNEQLEDAATRSLGEWMNTDAGPVLLDLAKTLPNEKYQVRAMRGYIRLARQFASNDKQRVEMCQQAFAASKRTAEQKLVLDILSRTSNLPALKLAVKAAQVPELKDEAARVAQGIYDRLPNKTPEAKELLAKASSSK